MLKKILTILIPLICGAAITFVFAIFMFILRDMAYPISANRVNQTMSNLEVIDFAEVNRTLIYTVDQDGIIQLHIFFPAFILNRYIHGVSELFTSTVRRDAGWGINVIGRQTYFVPVNRNGEFYESYSVTASHRHPYISGTDIAVIIAIFFNAAFLVHYRFFSERRKMRLMREEALKQEEKGGRGIY